MKHSRRGKHGRFIRSRLGNQHAVYAFMAIVIAVLLFLAVSL